MSEKIITTTEEQDERAHRRFEHTSSVELRTQLSQKEADDLHLTEQLAAARARIRQLEIDQQATRQQKQYIVEELEERNDPR